MKVENESFLYHYFERKVGPFLTLSALSIEDTRETLIAKKNAGQFGNLDIEDFLKKRWANIRNGNRLMKTLLSLKSR